MEPITANTNSKIEVRVNKASTIKKLFIFLKKNPYGIVGMLLVLLSVCCALFADWLAPMDPSKASLTSRLMPPIWANETDKATYLLGTDQLGRDLLSRIIHGAKISLMVGFFGVIIAMTIGTLLGLISGYFGKWLDDLIMRLADIQLAFPFILFAIVIMSVLGTGVWKIIIILGLTYWVGFARVIRGQVISVKELEYVQAAKAVGGTHLRIITKHIFPNVGSE
jgi:peptide/nickel transport system permease protein